MTREVGLFEGTARYYFKYRPHYPSEIYHDLIERFRLSNQSKILDLGSGPGIISIPMSEMGLSVIAIDPDVEMITEGLKIQKERGIIGILWGLGDDTTLELLNLPKVNLCIMGASFHWTNREELLKKLDNMIGDGGAVVVLSSGVTEWTSNVDNWNQVVNSVVQKYLGPKRRAGSGIYDHPPKRHQEVLAESTFCSIEILEYSKIVNRNSDEIIGLTLSKSYSSPAQLGDKIENFKADLKRELLKLKPSEEFRSEEKFEVIIARRP